MPSIKIDDVLAALILSLAMMRRIEVRTAKAERYPEVPVESFEAWRRRALRAYDLVAAASLLKVALNVGWYSLATKLRVGTPWLQLPGLLIFLGWIIAMVVAWKLGTDARHERLRLGIDLKRRASSARG